MNGSVSIMLTIFSVEQNNHRPAYIVRDGEHVPSYDAPERIDSILSAIDERKLGSVIAPDNPGLDPICAVHNQGMIQYLSTAYARHNRHNETLTPVLPDFFPPTGQRRLPNCFDGQKGYYCTDMEAPIDKNTWDSALASAHCAWTGAMRLRSGESRVYALCRPPGHHAGPDFMGGYCYLNNAAIAAQALRENDKKVAILDIDYHHGNGTQAIFYAAPEVWYGSLHVDPDTAYPFFAGYADEKGDGAARGANLNMPLPAGISQDRYLSTLQALLEHLASFAPHWLVISAGFDTYIHDPIGAFQITTAGFRKMGEHIRELDIPTLVVQEGGYHVPDLGLNVLAFLEGLFG